MTNFDESEFDYEKNLDPDTYLSDGEDEIDEYPVNKNKVDFDNDTNLNNYIDDDDDDEEDIDHEIDYEDNEDIEDEEDNYNEDNVHFIDNDLDNDSQIQYIVKSEDKITSNILTIYEINEIIGIRATQISNGSYVFTDFEYLSNPIEIAKKELLDNKCPLFIKRYIGLDKYELWDVNEMVKNTII